MKLKAPRVSLALGLALLLGYATVLQADESDAKRILKSMSDYMGAQTALAIEFDATLGIVTTDGQVLDLASSGSVVINRPDKIRAKRSLGFADIEMVFDGKTLTLLGKGYNLYTQLEVPGTLDHLIDELKNTYNRPLPAADLLLSASYEEMMHDVIDIKDLGTGVVGGVVCDFLAFRTEEVDWQIWIAQGEKPYPCRFVITSKLIENSPTYVIQTTSWKTGAEVAKDDFTFSNTSNAAKVEFDSLQGVGDLPDHFSK
jgi:hypothetical protein